MNKYITRIKKLWHDPVWSKVIAVNINWAIVSVIGLIVFVASLMFSDDPVATVVQGANTTHQESKNTEQLSNEELGIRNLILIGCSNDGNARQRYELSQEVSDQSLRDSQLIAISHDAACAGDYELVLEVYSTISSQQAKNRSAKWLVDFYIGEGIHSKAEHWAKLISDPQDRDWWIGEIMERAKKGVNRDRTPHH